jgi:hypothetical protein
MAPVGAEAQLLARLARLVRPHYRRVVVAAGWSFRNVAQGYVAQGYVPLGARRDEIERRTAVRWLELAYSINRS